MRRANKLYDTVWYVDASCVISVAVQASATVLIAIPGKLLAGATDAYPDSKTLQHINLLIVRLSWSTIAFFECKK